MLFIIISLVFNLYTAIPAYDTTPITEWEVVEVNDDYSEAIFNIHGELHRWVIEEAFDDIIVIEYDNQLYEFQYIVK